MKTELKTNLTAHIAAAATVLSMAAAALLSMNSHAERLEQPAALPMQYMETIVVTAPRMPVQVMETIVVTAVRPTNANVAATPVDRNSL
ncbi:MAG: hypothetical protein JNM52_06410 [Betaproteobacteria bacterium]|nr:hypothetical protein [Betaproteobacteria bacterium]